jgi:hypothetical protein
MPDAGHAPFVTKAVKPPMPKQVHQGHPVYIFVLQITDYHVFTIKKAYTLDLHYPPL